MGTPGCWGHDGKHEYTNAFDGKTWITLINCISCDADRKIRSKCQQCMFGRNCAGKKRKVYIRYICDDQMKLYCNGKYLFGKDYCIDQTECRLLTNETVSQIVEGDNVLAAYGRNTGGLALLDFGLYVENKTYADAELAILKQMDVQTTQTHYAFQCGDVELRIDFVSPALSEKWNLTGWPVGFFTYHIHSEDKKQHNVEIMFDVDMKWLFASIPT